jgi:hypothetical protein
VPRRNICGVVVQTLDAAHAGEFIFNVEEKMAKSSASDVQSLNNLCQLFRLLSDRTRLQIVMLLSAGERNVTSLCEELKLPQPTVSHHLGLLRMNRVIVNKRHGKKVIYALETGGGRGGKLKFSTPPYGVTVEGF